MRIKKEDLFEIHSKELWFKDLSELDEAYDKYHSDYLSRDVYETAKENAVKFADKCKVDIDTSVKLPDYPQEACGNENLWRIPQAFGIRGNEGKGIRSR